MRRLAAVGVAALCLFAATQDACADACDEAAAREWAAQDKVKTADPGSLAAAQASREIRAALAQELDACRGRRRPSSEKEDVEKAPRPEAGKTPKAARPARPRATAAFADEAERRTFGEKLAADAIADLNRLEGVLKAERAACEHAAPCQTAIGALEEERLAQAVQVLSLTFRWSPDANAEARRLIASGRFTSDANLEQAIVDLLGRTKDREKATSLVWQLSRLVGERDRDSLARRLTLVSAMDNTDSRAELIAHFRRIERLGGKLPPPLSAALANAEKEPGQVVDALARLNADQARAVYADFDSMARARQIFKDELAQFRGHVLVVAAEGLPAACDPGVQFRAALLGYLAPDPASTNQDAGPSVLKPSREKYRDMIEAATCACRGPSTCPDMPAAVAEMVKEIPIACEAIFGVELAEVEGSHEMRAEGRLRLLGPTASKKEPYKEFKIHGAPFSADCNRDVLADNRAAQEFFESFVDQLHAYWSAPVRDHTVVVAAESGVEPPSAVRALILAGLPQLTDGDPRNDTHGKVLAGLDLGMSIAGVGLVGASIAARDYAGREPDRQLGTANVLLGTGLTLLGLVIAERFASAYSYWRDHP